MPHLKANTVEEKKKSENPQTKYTNTNHPPIPPMTSFIPDSNIYIPNITGSTLIIPSISIGNIPQLSIDLLIHTLNFIKIGTLDDVYLYPFASPIDYSKSSKKGISHSIEIFYNEELNLTLIQQRSPILPSYITSYVSEIIIPFIKFFTFKKIVILDSLDAGLFEHVNAGDIEIYNSESLLSKSLESLKLNNEKLLDEQIDQHSNYVKYLLQELNLPRNESSKNNELNDIDVNVLVSFVYEGDNFYDGEKLAFKLSDFLNINKKIDHWVRPVSWFGAYGDKPIPNAMEEGLFG